MNTAVVQHGLSVGLDDWGDLCEERNRRALGKAGGQEIYLFCRHWAQKQAAIRGAVAPEGSTRRGVSYHLATTGSVLRSLDLG